MNTFHVCIEPSPNSSLSVLTENYLGVQRSAQNVEPVKFPAQVLDCGVKLSDSDLAVDDARDFTQGYAIGFEELGNRATDWDIDFLKGRFDFQQDHANAVGHAPTVEVNEYDITTI